MRSDSIDRALTLPNGALFYRCALQVNPHHYSGSFRGQPNETDEAAYVDAILSKCSELKIRVIGITDHNNANSVDLFRIKGGQCGVKVFPGFELTSSEGVHVLCLYSPETSREQLNRYLGHFGIQELDPSPKPSRCRLAEIFADVPDQKGICIAAHVTSETGGLLAVLKGQPRMLAWKDPNLTAVQIPGRVDETPVEYRSILTNKNPEHRRSPAADDDLAVAVINGADVSRPEDLEKPAASCWIKMSEISIEGLRQAFLDPSSRIRLASDGEWERHAELLTIAWEGGFLNGGAIHFNENLNILAGGRGTGKSTVIESIRYVLGLDPLGEDAKKQHEGFVAKVLGNGTKISVCLRSYSPACRAYRIERTVPNPPVVRDQEGNLLNLRPSDVFPGVEIYGQHEISELTKRPEKLTRLLDRFAEQDPSLPQRKREVLHQLEKSRTRILETSKELKQVEDRLASLPGVEETLKKFQQAGVEDRLKQQSLFVGEERVFKTAAERIQPVKALAEMIKDAVEIDLAFLSEKALGGLPSSELLRELEPVLEALRLEGLKARDVFRQAVVTAETSMATIRSRWIGRKEEAQTQYEKILRELQRSRIDGQEFIRLRQQAEDLRPLAERREVLFRTMKAHQDNRRNLLVEWEELKRQEFQSLEKAAKKVTRAMKKRVRVVVTYAKHRDPLVSLLREQIGGRLLQALEQLENEASLSLTEFVAKCREGSDSLAARYRISRTQAEKLASAPDETIMKIEELDLTAGTSIELNIAATGAGEEWRSLEALSTGQKATAVLLLLLLTSDAPLVVDQPEDDLDNRFITDGIVPKMREEKRRRQFIFATHNANIPVLGDAELITCISTTSDETGVRGLLPESRMGSIDKPEIREAVGELLEGGREAFELRRRKYGF
ncbi:MAG: phosphoesterase [Thermoanaerobaculia bacterium]|nr:hypothetical protein [Thermoanaerobaculia bacterium]MCK6682554.1 phosphoesterase [Thermoanaerobaculia bacterium]